MRAQALIKKSNESRGQTGMKTVKAETEHASLRATTKAIRREASLRLRRRDPSVKTYK